MSTAEERLQRLLPRVYEAGGNPDVWPLLLGDLAEHLGGTACALKVHNFNLRKGTIYKAWGYDPDYVRTYVDRYSPLNVWLQEESRYRPAGTILVGQQLVPDAELIRSEFYNDWLRPQGLHHRLCGVILRDGGSAVYLAAMRPRHKELFGAHETARLRPLLGHLEQAVRLHRRLTLLQMERDEARHALDLLPTGILIVGERGEILVANRRAQEILEAGDGLMARCGMIQTEHRQETEQLRGLIAGAVRTARGLGTEGSRWRPGGIATLGEALTQRIDLANARQLSDAR